MLSMESFHLTIPQPPQLRCLDVLGQAEINRLLAEAQQKDQQEQRDDRLLCIACGHLITRRQESIAAGGAHAHTCTNPHGITFHIGCFRQALGCREIGAETKEFSWFPGYGWRIALCAGCGVHLGWGFRSRDGDRFFGLILDRLARPSDG